MIIGEENSNCFDQSSLPKLFQYLELIFLYCLFFWQYNDFIISLILSKTPPNYYKLFLIAKYYLSYSIY